MDPREPRRARGISRWKAVCTKTCTYGLEGGCPEKAGFIQHEHGTSPGGPPYSYGFRPGRGCHDAIVAIHTTASGKSAKRLWALDADLQSAFDRLSHDHILTSLGTSPHGAWCASG